MVFESQTKLISLIPQGQRGTSIFLTLNPGPKASILKAGRLVFNIKGNHYRLVARVQYQASVLVIRFFGTHAEYDI
jgi:hypothetical protein